MRSLWLTILLCCLAGCFAPGIESELASAQDSYAAEDVRSAAIHLQNVLQAEPTNAEARLLAGHMAFYIGDFAQAVGHLELARDHGASVAQYAPVMARAYAATNRAADGLLLLDSVAAAERNDVYWLARADVALNAADEDTAAAALDNVSGEADAAALLLSRARLATARGDRAAARALVDQAVALSGSDADALAFRGSVFSDGPGGAGDLERAANIYERRFQRNRAAPVLLNLVQVRLASNDNAGAAEAAARLAALMPNMPMGDYAQALVAYQRGEFGEALQLLRKANSAAQDQPQVLALLGAVNLALGNFSQAEQHLLTVLNQNPSDPAAVRLLAETRIRQQRPQAALDALRLFDSTRDSEDFGLLLLEGVAYLQSRQPEQAIPHLEQARAMNPTHPGVVLPLLQAYSAVGRVTDIEALASSTEALGGDVSYAAQLSVILARLRDGDAEAAAAYVEELRASRPDDVNTHMAAAIFSQLTGAASAAKQELGAAVALDRSFIPAHLLLAAIYESEGLVDKAKDELVIVTQIEPAHLVARMALAQIAMEAQDLATAETQLSAAADGSDSPAPDIALAQLFVSRGDFDRADSALAAAARATPDAPEILAVRGAIAVARGAPEEAIRVLRQAEAALPDRPNVALSLAQAQFVANDGAGARDTLARAVDRMPTVQSLRAALGAAELRIGNSAEALRIAKDLQTEFAQQPVGYSLEGQLRMAERRYAEAEQMFRLAYQRAPRWQALVAIVTAVRLGGDTAGATALVEQWLGERPDDVAARLYYADLLMTSERGADAMPEYRRVIDRDPDNVVALNNAAWLAYQSGEPDALPFARRAAAAAPQNAAVLDTLGWILTQQNQAGEGLEYLRSATQLSPEALEIRYHLGFAEAQLGRTDAARETLRSLLGENQTFDSRRAAEELLGTL